MLCACWLRNVRNVLRASSRHNRVQFVIFYLARCLRACHIASLLFAPPELQIIGQQNETRLFFLFAHLHDLSSGFLFFDLLSSALPCDSSHLFFHFFILSELWLLNFLRSYYHKTSYNSNICMRSSYVDENCTAIWMFNWHQYSPRKVRWSLVLPWGIEGAVNHLVFDVLAKLAATEGPPPPPGTPALTSEAKTNPSSCQILWVAHGNLD